MPAYDHVCLNCQGEFELEYSIKVDPPTLCPLCNFDGQVQRLISGPTPGKVLLAGQDLKDKITADAKAMSREVRTNENAMANLMGESNYHQNALANNRRSSELTHLGRQMQPTYRRK